MRKIITMLWLTLFLGSGVAATGCAGRTAQQKKTASYKRKAKSGHIPCPCDSH
ncbi:hypothetical protein [Hymenobacter cavernae]|uniref:hypothetical protein n=1 Tax=Hymenobacter cavernae TaxID=2044852 RepID=UPI00166D7853|nr:hypothetical protein [Hymenobacter cavernae]